MANDSRPQFGKGIPRFLISGVQNQDELLSLHNGIVSLGGRIEDLYKSKFTGICTHVIAKEFSTTEKVLGALAGGKWLLKPEYVIDSVKQGRWLAESNYELQNQNEVAKHCRLFRKRKGKLIFEGWTMFIILENKIKARSFRRIAAGGGAEIASPSEMSKVDLVISDAVMVNTARSLVGCITPIVSMDYIKDTLLLKADPLDLRRYVIDGTGNTYLLRKYNAVSSTAVAVSEEVIEIDDDFQVTLPAEVPSSVASQFKVQTEVSSRLNQWLTKSHGKNLCASSQVCQEPGKNMKRKFLNIPFTPEKHYSILNYFESEAKHLGNAGSSSVRRLIQGEEQRGNFQPQGDEVVVVDEIQGKPAQAGNDDDCFITGVVGSGKCLPKKRYVSFDFTEKERLHIRTRYNELVEKNKLRQAEKNTKSISSNDISSSKCYDITSKQDTGNKSFSRNEQVCTRNLTNSSSLSNNSKSQFVPAWMLKDVRVNLGTRIDELQNNCKKGKRPSVSCEGVKPGRTLIGESDSTCQLVITEDDLKKALVTMIKSASLNNIAVYCADISQCLIDSQSDSQNNTSCDETEDLDSDQMLYPPNHIKCSSEIRELTVYETSYYESSLDDVREYEHIVHGLESLYLNISPNTYLPVQLFADLLKKFVFETCFRIVHSRSLGLAYYILAFHPPVNSSMRAYYLRVLNSTMQNSEPGFHRAWKFIHSVLEALQTHLDLEEKDDSQSSSAADDDTDDDDNDTTIVVEHSLGLLKFLVALFKKDVKGCKSGETVMGLLTWRVFWGDSRSPAATMPVKQLIQFWVSMASAPSVIKHYLSQLVCMLLELAWRSNKQFLIPSGPLPDSLLATGNEMHLRMKDYDSRHTIKLILDLSSPWAKMVVCSIIFQRVAGVQDRAITLADIKSQHDKASTPFSPTRSQLSTPPAKRGLSPHLINKQNHKGETPLIRACMKNNVKRVQEILKVPGVDINITDNSGWTAIHEAVICGYDQCVELLLNHNCHDVVNTKKTMYSYVKKCENSLGVNVRARGGDDKRTPLHDAVESNHLSTAKLLLDYGGGDLLKDKTKGGKTPLNLATTTEMRQLLNSYKGAPPSLAAKKNNELHKLKSRVISPDFSMPSGILPNLEDQMTFILAYVNSYMEVCGIRHLEYVFLRELRKASGNHLAENAISGDTQANCNMTAGATEATQGEAQPTYDRLKRFRTQGGKSVYARVKQLFSESETPTHLEKAFVDEKYDNWKLDMLTCKDKNLEQHVEDETDFERELRAMFI
ncbi:SMC5-SMC6 complex localization factor protein 1 isoform X3 [Cherax quadricarinatus]|uniref:SMC5-SMC6 complex localization factor protein 1 isoform X3 n=1 Tax=Cherax quadricarinatus TaxID=27406 RepID=UPI00387ED17E